MNIIKSSEPEFITDIIVTIILVKIRDLLEKQTELLILCDTLEDAYSDKLDKLSHFE